MPKKSKPVEVETMSFIDPPVNPAAIPPSSVMKKNALSWYVVEYDLIPAHSAPPQYNFIKRSTGNSVSAALGDIVNEYKQWKKEDAKRKKQENASQPVVPRLY